MKGTTDVDTSPIDQIVAQPAPPEGAYVATKPCGCITLIVMERSREAGKEVGKAIRLGEIVERKTIEEVRALPPLRCSEHQRPQKKAKQAPARQGGLL